MRKTALDQKIGCTVIYPTDPEAIAELNRRLTMIASVAVGRAIDKIPGLNEAQKRELIRRAPEFIPWIKRVV